MTAAPFRYCDGCDMHDCSPEKGCAYPGVVKAASPTPGEPVDGLVAELRALADYIDQQTGPLTIREEGDRIIYRQAADRIEADAARIKALETALEPFVKAYQKHYDPGVSDLDNEQPVAWHVPLGAYRRARATK